MNLSHRTFKIPGFWCVHSYYTLNPWAPDNSGRWLIAGANLKTQQCHIFILDSNGEILDQFGDVPATQSFWHTGLWQSWSPDARHVYYQSGTQTNPKVTRRELATGIETIVDSEMEGLPSCGEPGITGLHGMLYAAGYSSKTYEPENSPVPFQARDKHGLFKVSFDPAQEELCLTVNDVLKLHPDRKRLLDHDQIMKEKFGPHDGLTLMIYCVRWNPQGDRFLFYFGNHCVAKDRGEPRIASVFTAKKDLSDLHLAIDLSFDRRGVHWGWLPDGEHLLGYGPKDEGGIALSTVRYDGSQHKIISQHKSGGHPNVCPTEPRLAVTDESSLTGRIVFIDIEHDVEVAQLAPGRVNGDSEPAGRNPFRVCHHPVFSTDGQTLLFNTLSGDLAQLATVDVAPVIERLRSGAHLVSQKG